MLDWTAKLDILEEKGYKVTDRLVMPDGTASTIYPTNWTPEQMVNRAWDWVKWLETETNNKWAVA